jgi:hypothetical protein
MSSSGRLKTNRANARASTGPKTARGKARASRNAYRHGLNIPVLSDPILSKDVETFASDIAGRSASNEIYRLAENIALCQAEVIRIRQARYDLLVRNIDEYARDLQNEGNAKLETAIRMGIGESAPIPDFAKRWFRTELPQGPKKLALILSGFAKQLSIIDRYERRALSRRKFAIRAFDFARYPVLRKQRVTKA